MAAARKAGIWIGLPVLALVGTYAAFHEYVRAAAFVVQAAGLKGLAAATAELEAGDITERPMRVPWRGGQLAGRWYAPSSSTRMPILLVPGVHASGIEEPRLVGVARDLASVGAPVLTVLD